ncbi:MAG TPA: alpha/beta fold hydrolase, partial [Oceanipulchritudo sp.]|nr:alpha/beta fold hydrolase [Oceanipulchritudo sp.]
MNDLPPWLSVLYPFDKHRFQTADGGLNFVDEGSGPAVVMFHGNPTWSFLYRDLILALRPSFHCLALDNLGCGLSDKPQGGDYSLAGHITRATQWVEAQNLESFHLVVHDWGGPIGLGMAGKLRDKVRSISILNTAAFTFKTIPLRIAVCRWPLMGALLVRGANGFVRAATRMTTSSPLPEAVQAGYTYPYGNWH